MVELRGGLPRRQPGLVLPRGQGRDERLSLRGRSGPSMTVGLIYPPADRRHEECFPMPSISIAALADFLRSRGHQVRLYDGDILFHKRLRELPGVDFRILADQESVLRFLRGRLRGAAAARLRRIQGLFWESLALEPCGLYGISLVDLMSNRFMLHSAALIAQSIRRRLGRPVVLGFQGISRSAYREILQRYPVFDYAIWSLGEVPLLRLVEQLSGQGAVLLQTLARSPEGIREHVGQPPSIRCGGMSYRGYPLDLYRVSAAELLARYSARSALAKLQSLQRGAPDQLVVMYRFDTSCKGRCAFCANDNSVPDNRNASAAVVADLRRLQRRGVTGVYFTNANFNNDYREAERLCELMVRARLRLQWSDCVNFRELDEALLEKMRRSGAVRLTFGMETASPRLLRYIKKGVNRERIERLLRQSHALGIWNHIELIGGLPTETPADLAETTDFIRAMADVVDQFTVSPFTLYRQSPFFREAGRYGLALRGGNAQEQWQFSCADCKTGVTSEAFDEKPGLSWPRKQAQVRGSSLALAAAIQEAAPFGAMNRDHTHLLFHLYRLLGHGQKGLTRRVFRAATRRFKPYHMDRFPDSVDLLAG
ncbi:MAG: radical SAM protein [Elusimicrobia bacterium]|nr:radical SAM protein [Elusimicrobiota bacterium]